MSEMKDVRVKALEWVELGFAHTSTGVSYRILREPGYWKLEKHEGPSTTNSAHANEDAAKAAAQADYERRILAALEPAAKPKYSARDAFLSLTDGSNWPEMKGDYFSGYQDAMEQVHQHVMDFWPELSATDLPEPSPKPAGGEWVTVPTEPTKEMVWAFWNASGPDAERYRAMLAAAPPAPAASPSGGQVGRALRAIAEGYRVHGERDRYVVVENPEFKPDDGSNPCICIDVSALTSPEAPQASEVVREAVEFLGWVAKSYEAHAKCTDDPEELDAYHGSAEMARQHAAALAKIGGDHDK